MAKVATLRKYAVGSFFYLEVALVAKTQGCKIPRHAECKAPPCDPPQGRLGAFLSSKLLH